MPVNALKRFAANNTWKYFRWVTEANFANPVCRLIAKSNPRDNWSGLMSRNQAESITQHNRAKGNRSQDDSMTADGQPGGNA